MKYVSERYSLPFIPKLYGTLSEQDTNRKFIIMEYIEGQTVQKLWPSLEADEKTEVCRQLKRALGQIRSLPSPNFIGSVSNTECLGGLFSSPPPGDPLTSGPFTSEHAMNEGMLRRVARSESKTYIDFLRNLVASTLHGHRICFAHADLQGKNVMIRRKHRESDGGRNLSTVDRNAECAEVESRDALKGGYERVEVIVLDWEFAGWYPEYWDFCSATFVGRFRSEWLEVVMQVLDVYAQEHLMLQVLRSSIFG